MTEQSRVTVYEGGSPKGRRMPARAGLLGRRLGCSEGGCSPGSFWWAHLTLSSWSANSSSLKPN